MPNYIKLTDKQERELKRLVQRANRRIKAAERQGKSTLPREQWHTPNTPISRSTKFTSKEEFQEHLKMLRNVKPATTTRKRTKPTAPKQQYIELTPAQKDELRRLTQLANRRIKAAERAYRKAGREVLPREVVGDFQIKEQWHTPDTPISRSIKFTSYREFRRHMQMLREFERLRPGIKEYTTVQREKTLIAIESALGVNVPPELEAEILKMSAPQLADFWERFSNKASKMGIKYSSDAVMTDTLQEFFPEDTKNFVA